MQRKNWSSTWDTMNKIFSALPVDDKKTLRVKLFRHPPTTKEWNGLKEWNTIPWFKAEQSNSKRSLPDDKLSIAGITFALTVINFARPYLLSDLWQVIMKRTPPVIKLPIPMSSLCAPCSPLFQLQMVVGRPANWMNWVPYPVLDHSVWHQNLVYSWLSWFEICKHIN